MKTVTVSSQEKLQLYIQHTCQSYLTYKLWDKLYINLFSFLGQFGDQDNGFRHLFRKHWLSICFGHWASLWGCKLYILIFIFYFLSQIYFRRYFIYSLLLICWYSYCGNRFYNILQWILEKRQLHIHHSS